MKPEEAKKILSEVAFGKSLTTGARFTDALKIGVDSITFAENVLKLMPIVFTLPQPSKDEAEHEV